MRKKKLVRVGLIGPGQIADQRLIPALKKLSDVQFWSVLGRDPFNTAEVARKHEAQSEPQTYSEMDAFLADPYLDAVIIATPDRLHAAQCIAAANAGKHIFVEKPMATTLEEANEIVKTVSETKVRLAVGYHLRFHAGHQMVAKLLKEGRIGKVLHMRVTWTMKADRSDWRSKPKTGRWWSLGATGTHALDLARWLMTPGNGPIVEARATISNSVFKGPHDETAVVALKFRSGATASVTSSVVFKAPRTVEIFGSTGSIVCTDTLGPRGEGTITLNGEPVAFTPVDPYQAELANFIRAVRNGTSPRMDVHEGADNIRLLVDATYGTKKVVRHG